MELAGARRPSACARARWHGFAVSPPCPSPLKIGTCRVTSALKHIGCLSEGSRGRKLASLVNGARISTPRLRPPRFAWAEALFAVRRSTFSTRISLYHIASAPRSLETSYSTWSESTNDSVLVNGSAWLEVCSRRQKVPPRLRGRKFASTSYSF